MPSEPPTPCQIEQAFQHDQNMDHVPLLAERLSLNIDFDYSDANGDVTRRSVHIRKVFGHSQDTPKFIRGWCSLREGIRTFDIERIASLNVPNGAIVKRNASLYVQALINRHRGLCDQRPPIHYEGQDPIVVELIDNGAVFEMRGVLREVLFEQRSYGPRAYLTFKPDAPFRGARRWIKLDLMNDLTGYDMKSLSRMDCGKTGEHIDDVYAWAAQKIGLSSNGWPPAYD